MFVQNVVGALVKQNDMTKNSMLHIELYKLSMLRPHKQYEHGNNPVLRFSFEKYWAPKASWTTLQLVWMDSYCALSTWWVLDGNRIPIMFPKE